MNNKTEKILLISIVFIVLIIILIVSIILITSNKNIKENGLISESNVTPEYGGDDVEGTFAKGIDSQITRDAYNSVSTCIGIYLSNINIEKSSFYRRDSNDKNVRIIDEKEIKQIIYDILSENYKAENKINLDNLYTKTRTLKEQTMYIPLELSVLQDNQIKSFITHGLVENAEFKVIAELYAVVNIDFGRKLFSIQPLSGKYSSINDVKVDNLDTTIVENQHNTFSLSSTYTYEDTAREYIDLYKKLAIGSPSKMYNLLDKDYREKRFGSEDSFKKYVENNKDRIYGLRLEQYDASEKEGYTQYICIDQYENTYIFREKSVLDYSALLDTYTVDIPEFTEKYDRANDSQKVVLNIQKVLTAINNRDYSYVFSKLDSTYKANNFKQNSDFKNYIDKNYFIANTAEYGSCKQEGNVYICTFKIKDSTGKNTNTQERKIAMQLLNNRDFVMSFIFE